ncbi:hypothetical protein NO1_0037 [Candidatus Termititenax aidoneus]|uniref:Uncharacterized protein n=1 Tax=Termititenax aidoneus TaxID=2218524 RepID=A0A388T777_TERA1|nr:hypothetical protein NO1_0037 [Candidatus Termititenax aidoneus]
MVRQLYTETVSGFGNSIRLWQVPDNATESDLAKHSERDFTSVDEYINPRLFVTNKDWLRRDLYLRIEENEIDAGTLAEILASSQDAAVKALIEDIYQDIQAGAQRVDNNSADAVHGHKVLGVLLEALSKLYETPTQTSLSGTRQIIDTTTNRKDTVYMPLTFDWLEDTFPFIKNMRQPDAPNQSAYVSEITDTTKPNLGLSYAEAARRYIDIAYAPGGQAEGEISLETVPGFSVVFAKQIKDGAAAPKDTKPLMYAERPEGKEITPPPSLPAYYKEEKSKDYELPGSPQQDGNTYLYSAEYNKAGKNIDKDRGTWRTDAGRAFLESLNNNDVEGLTLSRLYVTMNAQRSEEALRDGSRIDETSLKDGLYLNLKRPLVYLMDLAWLALTELGVKDAAIKEWIPDTPVIPDGKSYSLYENQEHFLLKLAELRKIIDQNKDVSDKTSKFYVQLLQSVVDIFDACTFARGIGTDSKGQSVNVVTVTFKPNTPDSIRNLINVILTVSDYQTAKRTIAGYNENTPATPKGTIERLEQDGSKTILSVREFVYNAPKSTVTVREEYTRDESGTETIERAFWNGQEVRVITVADGNKNAGSRTVIAEMTTKINKISETPGEITPPRFEYPDWTLTFTETTLIYPHLNEKNPQGIVGLLKAGKIDAARAAYDKLTGEVYSHILAQLDYSKDPQALRAIARVTAQLEALEGLIKAHNIAEIERAYIARRAGEISDLAAQVNKYDLNSGSLAARQANLQKYLLELEAQQALHAEEVRKRRAQPGAKYSLQMPLLKQSADGVYTGAERDEDNDGVIDTIAEFNISATYTSDMDRVDKTLDNEIARIRQMLCGHSSASAAQNYLIGAFSVSTEEEQAVLLGLAQRLQAEANAQKAAAGNDQTYQPQIAEATKKFWLSLLLAHLPAADAPETWITPADRAFVENLAKELKVTKATAPATAPGANSAAHVLATQEAVETAKADLRENLVQEVFDKIREFYLESGGKSPTEKDVANWIADALTASGLQPALNILIEDRNALQDAHKLKDGYVSGTDALAEALAAKSILVFDNTNVMPVEIRCNPGTEEEMLQLAENMLAALQNADRAEADKQAGELQGLIAFNAALAEDFGRTVENFGQQLKGKDFGQKFKTDYLELMQATDPDAPRKLLGANPDYIDGRDVKWRVGDAIPPDWGVVDTAWHSIVPPEGTDGRIQAMSHKYEELANTLDALKNVDEDKLQSDPEYYNAVRGAYQTAYDLLRGGQNEKPGYAVDHSAEYAGVSPDKGIFGHLTDEANPDAGLPALRPQTENPELLLQKVKDAVFPQLDAVLEERRKERNEAFRADYGRELDAWLKNNSLASPEQKVEAAAKIISDLFEIKEKEWEAERDRIKAEFTEYPNDTTLFPFKQHFGEYPPPEDDKGFPRTMLPPLIAWIVAKALDESNLRDYNHYFFDPVSEFDYPIFGRDQWKNLGQTLLPGSRKITDRARQKEKDYADTVERLKADKRNELKKQYPNEDMDRDIEIFTAILQDTADKIAPKKSGPPILTPIMIQPFGSITLEGYSAGFSIASKYVDIKSFYEGLFLRNDINERGDDLLESQHVFVEARLRPFAWLFEEETGLTPFAKVLKGAFNPLNLVLQIDWKRELIRITEKLQLSQKIKGPPYERTDEEMAGERELREFLKNELKINDENKINEIVEAMRESKPGTPYSGSVKAILDAMTAAGCSSEEIEEARKKFHAYNTNETLPPSEEYKGIHTINEASAEDQELWAWIVANNYWHKTTVDSGWELGDTSLGELIKDVDKATAMLKIAEYIEEWCGNNNITEAEQIQKVKDVLLPIYEAKINESTSWALGAEDTAQELARNANRSTVEAAIEQDIRDWCAAHNITDANIIAQVVAAVAPAYKNAITRTQSWALGAEDTAQELARNANRSTVEAAIEQDIRDWCAAHNITDANIIAQVVAAVAPAYKNAITRTQSWALGAEDTAQELARNANRSTVEAAIEQDIRDWCAAHNITDANIIAQVVAAVAPAYKNAITRTQSWALGAEDTAQELARNANRSTVEAAIEQDIRDWCAAHNITDANIIAQVVAAVAPAYKNAITETTQSSDVTLDPAYDNSGYVKDGVTYTPTGDVTNIAYSLIEDNTRPALAGATESDVQSLIEGRLNNFPAEAAAQKRAEWYSKINPVSHPPVAQDICTTNFDSANSPAGSTDNSVITFAITNATPDGYKYECEVVYANGTPVDWTALGFDEGQKTISSDGKLAEIHNDAMPGGEYKLIFKLVKNDASAPDVIENTKNVLSVDFKVEVSHTGGPGINVNATLKQNPQKLVPVADTYEAPDCLIGRTITEETVIYSVNKHDIDASEVYSVNKHDIDASEVYSVNKHDIDEGIIYSVNKHGIDESEVCSVEKFEITQTDTTTKEVLTYDTPSASVSFYKPATEIDWAQVDIEELKNKFVFAVGPAWAKELLNTVKPVRNEKTGELKEEGWVLRLALELLFVSVKNNITYNVDPDSAEAIGLSPDEALAMLREQYPAQYENVDEQQWDVAYKLALGVTYQIEKGHTIGLEALTKKIATNDPDSSVKPLSDWLSSTTLAFTVSYRVPFSEEVGMKASFFYGANELFDSSKLSHDMSLKLAFPWRLADKLMLEPGGQFFVSGLRKDNYDLLGGTIGAAFGWGITDHMTLSGGLDFLLTKKHYESGVTPGVKASLLFNWRVF